MVIWDAAPWTGAAEIDVSLYFLPTLAFRRVMKSNCEPNHKSESSNKNGRGTHLVTRVNQTWNARRRIKWVRLDLIEQVSVFVEKIHRNRNKNGQRLCCRARTFETTQENTVQKWALCDYRIDQHPCPTWIPFFNGKWYFEWIKTPLRTHFCAWDDKSLILMKTIPGPNRFSDSDT